MNNFYRQYHKLFNQNPLEKIDYFDKEYEFLSNFYAAPVTYEGITYPSSEHAYQAAKTLDIRTRQRVAELATAGESKHYGRKLITLREDWEEVKIPIMRDIVTAKFEQNPELKEKLIATGDAYLEEGNWWGDIVWGTVNGVGDNWLGKTLMEVRENLKKNK